MNRRNFIGNLLAIGAGFTILPGAGRLWVPTDKIIRCKFEWFEFPQPYHNYALHGVEIGRWSSYKGVSIQSIPHGTEIHLVQ